MADEPSKKQIKTYRNGLRLLGLLVQAPDDVLVSQMSPEFVQFIVDTLKDES